MATIGNAKKGSDQSRYAVQVPGPGTYQPIKQQKQQSPSYRFGNSQRSKLNNSEAPGPGAYTTQTDKKFTPKFSFGLRPKLDTIAFQPGPGAYNAISNPLMMKTSPMFTFGGKNTITVENQQVPGPGSYEKKSTVIGIPSSKFPLAERGTFRSVDRTPGPGQYNTKGASSAPRYGFGTSERKDSSMERNPGPGEYSAQSVFDQNNKGYSIMAKRADVLEISQIQVPGPGAYNPRKPNKCQNPSYKIGTSLRSMLNTEAIKTPGPGAYDTNHYLTLPGSIVVRMGSSQRRPLQEDKKTPGPGNYDIPSKMVEGPQIQLLGHKFDNLMTQKDLVPGPGAYTFDTYPKHRPTTVRIGTSRRPDLARSLDGPGPGNYDGDYRKETTPAWGFGSSQRPPLNLNTETPGPGGYENTSRFGSPPKYATRK